MRRRVEVRACSITETGADFVLNASNDSATLGGGVSRAIFDECGGAALQQEMREKLADEFDGVLETAIVSSLPPEHQRRSFIYYTFPPSTSAGREQGSARAAWREL